MICKDKHINLIRVDETKRENSNRLCDHYLLRKDFKTKESLDDVIKELFKLLSSKYCDKEHCDKISKIIIDTNIDELNIKSQYMYVVA